jgi:hypothetical protein
LWLQLSRSAAGRAAKVRPMRRRSVRCCPAALALPGVVPATAHAQSAPDKGIFELQYLSYRDWQPGQKPDEGGCSRFLRAGADHRYLGRRRRHGVRLDVRGLAAVLQHAVGASIFDYRTAGDLKVTKYFGN